MMDSVRKIFPKTSYTTKKATIAQFNTHHSYGKILLLDLHGCKNDTMPLKSKILFTETGKDSESELTIEEIYNLDLNGIHTIIPACHAGYGKSKKGEGLISLARALSYAGSNSLVTTLWKANDQAALKIETLYLKYLKKGFQKHKALQKAKQIYLEKNDDGPWFWGNFVLIGNKSALNFKENKTDSLSRK